MRFLRSLLLATPIVLLIAAAPAGAAVPHTVQPGETLWSIAAANNLTTRTVAAFNGLSEDAQVVLGSTINVPTVAEGAAALQGTGGSAGRRAGRRVERRSRRARRLRRARRGDTLGGLANPASRSSRSRPPTASTPRSRC